jgi:beta-mannosidase
VYIESLPTERFTDVYFTTVAIEEDRVVLAAYWTYKTEVVDLSGYNIEFSLLDNGVEIASVMTKVDYIQGRIVLAIPKEKVKLWMPADFGEPYLYEARVRALKNGMTVSEHSHNFGIRDITFKMSEDTKDGEGRFDFTVNGEKIFIKGTNWKPLDPLPSIADAKTKDERALEHVKNLGCNMIRVWGGGIYEDEFFFDCGCCEHGGERFYLVKVD